MSFKKSLGLISLSALVGVLTYGCSSSSSNGGGGGGDDSGVTGDSGGTHHDGATGGDTGTGGDGGTGFDTGTTGDGGQTCAPGDVSTFMAPAYVPAKRQAGACAAADIPAYFTACLDSATATMATCTAFIGMKGTCSHCIEGPSTATMWGAVVDHNGVASVNLAGCMELKGGAAGLACAQTAQKASACGDKACDATCKVTDSASFQLYLACVQQADSNGCSMYAQAASMCQMTESGSDAGDAACLMGQTFQDLYNSVVPIFCGP